MRVSTRALLALLAAVALLAGAASASSATAERLRRAHRREHRRKGDFLKNIAGNFFQKSKNNFQENLFGKQNPVPAAMKAGVPDPKGAANRVLKTDERCVVCQYLVQRVNAELLLNGANGGVPFSHPQSEFERAARNAAAGHVEGSAPGQHGDPFDHTFTPPATQQPGTTEEQQTTEEATANLLEVAATAGEGRRDREGRRNIFQSVVGAVVGAQALSGGVNGMQEADMFNQGFKKEDFLPGGKAWRTPRERHIGMMAFRPTQQRYADMRDGPLRAAHRAQERYEENQMFSVAYQTLEDLCTKRMPAPYYGYCGLLMKNYERIAQGLRWKDRPDSICMGMGFCDKTSYIQKGPHAVYRPF